METLVKHKKNRRALRRNKVKNNNRKTELKLVGVNAAGLSSKFQSFENMLNSINPGVFFIEETKMKRPGKIKTESCEKYIIYELIRKKKGGGGIAIGVDKNLKPVFIDDGDDDIEIIIVEARTDTFKFRCVGAYGPQETDKIEKKINFWAKLSNEVENAAHSEAGFILQMDGNLRAGQEIIPGDPHQMNNNGKLFKEFLSNHSHLTVVNSLDICSGLITRSRKTKHRVEESVLDVFVVCDKVLPYVTNMVVDEKKEFVLTNFNKVKGETIVKDSDHNTLIMTMNIDYTKIKPKRVEVFNLKNNESQEAFKNITTNTNKLSKCFEDQRSFDFQSRNWIKTLKNLVQISFSKIRITNKIKITEENKLMERRAKIKCIIKETTEYDDKRESLEKEVNQIEEELAKSVSETNFKKAKENMSIMTSNNGFFNAVGMWKIKQRIIPKHCPPLPVAKVDSSGRLVSDPEELKKLYIETYIHRLRKRPIRPEFKELEQLKLELFNKRMKIVKLQKYELWNLENIRYILKALKKNKSRDPHGFINELFRPENIGSDMERSLLLLMNKIRQDIKIPELMQFANIVSIYKGKKSKNSLENDRGIFIMNIFRSILMKIIYNEEYETIDSNMSDSNIGARKRKNIRNHIFILNGIINEAINNKKAIDVVILDFKQCFDGMWIQDSLNDLYDAGVQNRNLAIIYEANRKNKVAVKTPNDTTERVVIEDIIMQGEVFAPLECSVSVDTFGKECQNDEKYLFYYRNSVGVPSLAMIDDLVNISECGLEAVKLNAFINAKANSKKFQFGKDKCHRLHFGCKTSSCPDLFIDTWKIEEKEEYDTNRKTFVDVIDNEHKIEPSDEEKYLGDILTTDGKNTRNIAARRARGICNVDKIFTYLNDVFLGPYYFEAALLYRSSLLLNSILVNSESWYNVTESDIQQLESVDNIFHRRVLETPRSTPISIMHLELGTLPIRFIIKKRRVLFLHYILKQNKDDLIFKFFEAQSHCPQRGDWILQVRKDLSDINLHLSFDSIKSLSESAFKLKVTEAIKNAAYNWLLSKIKEKGNDIIYTTLQLQKYFLSANMNIKQRNLLFALRAHMVPVKCNFRRSYEDLTCPVCKDTNEQDSQSHLLQCKILLMGENILVKNRVIYKDLYSSDAVKQSAIVKLFEDLLKKRRKYEEYQTQVIQT